MYANKQAPNPTSTTAQYNQMHQVMIFWSVARHVYNVTLWPPGFVYAKIEVLYTLQTGVGSQPVSRDASDKRQ